MTEENPFDPSIPKNPRLARRRLTPRQMANREREPIHEPLRSQPPRTTDYDPINDDDDDDRLKVHRHEIPDGMDYLWVTDSILGQPQPQRRARFERKGWVPVPAERHAGRWTPKGFKGEINVDGLVLMERPLELSIRARQKDRIRALDQVRAKEAQLTGGNIPGVSLDTQHETALRTNKLRKSYEGFTPPRED